MPRPKLFQCSDNPWANGLRLLLLNSALAVFSIASFLGVLFAVTAFNQLRRNAGGSPSAEFPFPYPLLLLLDAIVFLIAWFWFGRRLPSAGRARLVTALVGASPLFALSLLGYLGAAAAYLMAQSDPATMPVASAVVFSALSTLVLLASLASVGVTLWSGQNQPA